MSLNPLILTLKWSCSFVFVVEIFADRIPKCTECGGLVKPDIVFFGEALPLRFSSLVMEVGRADAARSDPTYCRSIF